MASHTIIQAPQYTNTMSISDQEFAQLRNLMNTSFPFKKPLHMIFWRNVMIGNAFRGLLKK